MTAFFRFPHTPHLAWLGTDAPRDDKVLSSSERRELLEGDVIIEEKVDGANLGFSIDEAGDVCQQNRGSYLSLDGLAGQWRPLKGWLSSHRAALVDALFPNLILFGEWCYARHSVRYTRLPDWFLAFDVGDKESGTFWSADRRDEVARSLDLAIVPRLGTGRFTLDDLKELLVNSRLSDTSAEGLYVRKERAGHLVTRAKLVRPEFVRAIGDHWSKRRIETNRLAPKPEK